MNEGMQGNGFAVEGRLSSPAPLARRAAIAGLDKRPSTARLAMSPPCRRESERVHFLSGRGERQCKLPAANDQEAERRR